MDLEAQQLQAVNGENDDLCKALHEASEEGDQEAVRQLLVAGVDAGASDKDGETPLHWASGGGHLEVVKLLLEAGADAGASDKGGYTPLHWASGGGHLEVVKLLLEAGADAGASDKDGDTPLHWASTGSHLEVVKLLLEARVDIGASDKDGDTPLHWASRDGHLEVVKLLLEARADIGASDKDGDTPLHEASKHGHLEVVKLLLEKADIGAQMKVRALTPAIHISAFMAAIEKGHWETAGLILDSSLGDDCGTTQCQGTERIRELHSLPDQELVTALHGSMVDELKLANMRLLCIEEVLRWDHLPVFELVPVEAYRTIRYSDTSDEIWSKTVVLSWRWAKSKPKVQEPGFSPMSIEQLQELKSMLHSVKAAAGLEYVWIDWCCAPQYSGDTMVEVLRSKVYYMRAQQLFMLPVYDRLPKDHQIVRALQGIQQLLLHQDLGHSRAASLLLSAVNLLLGQLQESDVYIASHEYYHRIWTLAERMARHGSSERLCNFMPLHTWVGMVLSVVDSRKPGSSGVCFQDFLGDHWDWDEASYELEKQGEGVSTPFHKLLMLLLKAVFTWHQPPASIPGMNAAPTKEWLRSYLADVHSGVYQAWDVADKVWGIYSYYSGVVRGRSLIDLLDALRELVELAIGQPPVCLSQLHVDTTSDEQATATQIQKLLVFAAVDVKAAVDMTDALWFAVGLRCSEAIGLLKSEGADVNDARDGRTPLHEASRGGLLEVVKLLLVAGADIGASDQDGDTPLHWASRGGHLEVVKLLLAEGADAGAKNKVGHTPLRPASRFGNLEVVKLLLAAGADASDQVNTTRRPPARH